MGSRLRRWFALPPAERWLFLRLLLGLPVIAGLLRVFGYVRTQSLLRRLSGRRPLRAGTIEDLQRAERLAALTALAGKRGLLAVTCLRQALLLDWLLRRRGLASEIRLGVRKRDGDFDAHAWVELAGVALGQADLRHQAFAGPGTLAADNSR